MSKLPICKSKYISDVDFNLVIYTFNQMNIPFVFHPTLDKINVNDKETLYFTSHEAINLKLENIREQFPNLKMVMMYNIQESISRQLHNELYSNDPLVFAQLIYDYGVFLRRINGIAFGKISLLAKDRSKRIWGIIKLLLIGHKQKENVLVELPMDMLKEIWRHLC